MASFARRHWVLCAGVAVALALLTLLTAGPWRPEPTTIRPVTGSGEAERVAATYLAADALPTDIHVTNDTGWSVDFPVDARGVTGLDIPGLAWLTTRSDTQPRCLRLTDRQVAITPITDAPVVAGGWITHKTCTATTNPEWVLVDGGRWERPTFVPPPPAPSSRW